MQLLTIGEIYGALYLLYMYTSFKKPNIMR